MRAVWHLRVTHKHVALFHVNTIYVTFPLYFTVTLRYVSVREYAALCFPRSTLGPFPLWAERSTIGGVVRGEDWVEARADDKIR